MMRRNHRGTLPGERPLRRQRLIPSGPSRDSALMVANTSIVVFKTPPAACEQAAALHGGSFSASAPRSPRDTFRTKDRRIRGKDVPLDSMVCRRSRMGRRPCVDKDQTFVRSWSSGASRRNCLLRDVLRRRRGYSCCPPLLASNSRAKELGRFFDSLIATS